MYISAFSRDDNIDVDQETVKGNGEQPMSTIRYEGEYRKSEYIPEVN